MKLPGGKDMILLYQRMMLASLSTDGVLYYEGTLNNIVEETATKLEETEENVAMTVSYFEKAGLLQVNNDISMLQVPALIAQETDWARYKRNQRDKQALLDNVQRLSNASPIEIEKEIELDKELKSEKDISSSSCINNKELVAKIEHSFGRLLSPIEIEEICKWVSEDIYRPDVILEAVKEAVFKRKLNLKYIQGILRNWKNDNLTTVELIEANRRERENNHLPKNVEVSTEFIEAMDYWKDQD
ncbi:DnaD domain protein [Streptococcus sp. B01]|nr:DnaD domain protein [Streptococcus sp. B01]